MTRLKDARNQRAAATIRHNRARGRHQITIISEITRELSQLGWDNDKVGKELGMDSGEALRLKQISDLQELSVSRQYSRAWTIKQLELTQAFSYCQQRRFPFGKAGANQFM